MSQDVFQHPLVQSAHQSALSAFTDKEAIIAVDGRLVRQTFFSHLWEVAVWLGEANFSPVVIAAGLLHHHIDQLREWSLLRIEKNFGASVANLVSWVDEHYVRLPWAARSELYCTKLHYAPSAALAVVCASRASAIRSINELSAVDLNQGALHYVGWLPWPETLAEHLDHYHELSDLFSGRIPRILSNRFAEQLDKLEQVKGKSDLGQHHLRESIQQYPEIVKHCTT